MISQEEVRHLALFAGAVVAVPRHKMRATHEKGQKLGQGNCRKKEQEREEDGAVNLNGGGEAAPEL
ncbi:hypothetical protein [Deinococcus humi]|uniref:Uncharacterized protein n=1 Tax=Deinococcus humi TaxID=662880 RepID=A0A7W8JU19_9DEIO|nr:hypothetical protein [Deinococcus humi]MBB5362798.1 hypothetical protein [Deinococcus humi]GGO26208.1 hypothetical protein GCM10008949_16810 [Deinococcus humi]